MAPVPLASSDATPVGSNNGNMGNNMNTDGVCHSRWQEHLAPEDPMLPADPVDTKRTITQSPMIQRTV